MEPWIKTRQLAHQEREYFAHRDDLGFGIFWEMGLGKTKLLLDIAAYLFSLERITGLLVVAPNAVYRNWLTQEAPVHLGVPYVPIIYPKSNTKEAGLKRLIYLDPDEPMFHGRLKVVTMSYDSVRTEQGFEFAQKFLKIHPSMMVVDESTAIANHDNVQTKRVKKLGKLARRRFIASGTPVANSPFQIHSQLEFIDPGFWADYGMKTYGAFKSQFGVFELRKITVQGGTRSFNERRGYQHLDKLHKIVDSISTRLLKEDSGVELPPKTYTTRTFELSESQRSVYDQLCNDYEAELDGGAYLEAAMAMTRLTRLQQITCGFVTAETFLDEEAEILEDGTRLLRSERKIVDVISFDENPRLRLLEELIEETGGHKVIVWCRFVRDVENICRLLGERCVRYDGSTSAKDREIALARFRDPADPARVFVANVHTISQGVTLTIAKTMIYYSNSYSSERRLQSEDRFHRIGQDSPVLIIDLAAEGTADYKVIDALKSKYEISAMVMGDRLRDWIR